MQQCWKKGKNQLKSTPISKIMRKMEKTSDNTVENTSPELRRRLAGSLPETTKLVGIRQTTPEISKPMTTDPIDDYKIAIQHQLKLLPKQTRFSGSHLRHLRQPLSSPNTTDQANQTTRPTTIYPQSRFVGMKPIFQIVVEQNNRENKRKKKKMEWVYG
jgi:hypothetical protein